MVIRKDERPTMTRENMRGGEGMINFRHLTTPESLPKNSRLLSEVSLKPGESIGAHVHEGETEVFFCISGSGSILEKGEYVKLKPGDVAVTNIGDPHSLKNDGEEDFVVLAIIILD